MRLDLPVAPAANTADSALFATLLPTKVILVALVLF